MTDGWYPIKAEFDEPLTALLRKGRIKVGDKLVMYGAELVGAQGGVAPLEVCAISTLCLRFGLVHYVFGCLEE